MKSLKVNIPEGFEIDKEKSTFEEIIFKPIKRELPKRWEELETIKGFYININSEVIEVEGKIDKKIDTFETYKNTFPTFEEAEASVALAQLCQLRNIYNEGWKPDWENLETKYCIIFKENKLVLDRFSCFSEVLHFKNVELAQQFLKNFRDLIEKAKPLL